MAFGRLDPFVIGQGNKLAELSMPDRDMPWILIWKNSTLFPLLANIVFDDFDKTLESRGRRFVRYADDGLIFIKSKRAAEWL